MRGQGYHPPKTHGVGSSLPAVRDRGHGRRARRRRHCLLAHRFDGRRRDHRDGRRSAGYYAAAYTSAVRWAYREYDDRPTLARLIVANLFAFRSVAIEFGPAELIDSIAIRPLAYYFGPMIFGNVAAGWIFGKLVSDIGFYALAIFSYERFNGLLGRGRKDERGGRR